jgi:hypothetical protein
VSIRPLATAVSLVLGCASAVLSLAGRAEAQSFGASLETRRPALGYGDLVLVRGPGVLPHLESAIGLDVDIVKRPLVVVDGATGAARAMVNTRATATILYGVGLFDDVQVTLAVPAVFQNGLGASALTGDPDDALPLASVGDLRLDFAWAPLPAPLAFGEATLDAGFASGLTAPTGEDTAFTGTPNVSGYIDAVGQLRVGVFRAQAAIGVRVSEESTVAQAGFGSALSGALALAVDLFDRRWVLAAQAQVLAGLVSNATFPVQALLESRVVVDDARESVAYVAFGGGLDDEVGAPEWQLVVGFRHRPELPGASGRHR